MNKKQIEIVKKKTEHYEKLSQELSIRTDKNVKSKRVRKKVKHCVGKRNKKNINGLVNTKEKKYESYKEYLKSPEWRKIRKRILKRANYKCELCKVARAYQVHHKHYKNIFKEKDKDLLAVCGVCHQDKHKILTDEYVEKRVNELIKQEGYH